MPQDILPLRRIDHVKFFVGNALYWLGEFRFDGHVEALEETLDSFSPDGRPLRARLSLSLRGETLPA